MNSFSFGLIHPINAIKRMSLFLGCCTPLFAAAPAGLAGAIAVGVAGAEVGGGTVAAAGAAGGVAEIGGVASAGAFLANPVVLGVIIGVGVLVLVGGGVYLIVKGVKKRQRAAQVNQAQAAAAVVPDIPPRELAIRNAMNFVLERPANREIDTTEVVRQVEALMAVVEERNHHQRAEEDRIRRERDRDELAEEYKIQREKDRNEFSKQYEIQREKDRDRLAEEYRIQREIDRNELFALFDDKVKMQLQEKDEKINGLEDNIKALQKELNAKNLIIQNLQKKPIITQDISTPLQQRRNKEGLLAQEKDFTELNLKMPGSIEPQKSEGEKVDKKVLEETQESIRKLLEAITPTLIHAQQCNKNSGSSGSFNPRLSFFSVSDIPQKLLDSQSEDNDFISVTKMSN